MGLLCRELVFRQQGHVLVKRFGTRQVERLGFFGAVPRVGELLLVGNLFPLGIFSGLLDGIQKLLPAVRVGGLQRRWDNPTPLGSGDPIGLHLPILGEFFDGGDRLKVHHLFLGEHQQWLDLGLQCNPPLCTHQSSIHCGTDRCIPCGATPCESHDADVFGINAGVLQQQGQVDQISRARLS